MPTCRPRCPPAHPTRWPCTTPRTVLAAMGLLGAVLAFEEGYDLRSRCVLIADGPLTIDLLAADADAARFTLTGDQAVGLYEEAVAELRAAGLAWDGEPVRLRPATQLVELVKRSRELTVQADAAEA